MSREFTPIMQREESSWKAFFAKYKWLNIFIRDLLLAILILWVNYKVGFRSWWAACITGMIIMLMAWHLSDLMEENRRIK